MFDSRASVDDRHWPIAIYTLEGNLALRDYQVCLDHMDVGLSRGSKFQIFDARTLRRPDLSVIQAQAKWIAKHRVAIRQNTVATLFVVDSPVVSYSLSAVFAISPMPVRAESVTQMGEAYARILTLASERRITLPASVVAFLHSHGTSTAATL